MRERPHCTEYTMRPSETWTAPIGSQHARRQHRGPRCRWSATNRHRLFLSPPATAYPRICTRPPLRLTGGAGSDVASTDWGPGGGRSGLDGQAQRADRIYPGPPGKRLVGRCAVKACTADTRQDNRLAAQANGRSVRG